MSNLDAILILRTRSPRSRDNLRLFLAILIVVLVQWSRFANSAVASCADYLLQHSKPVINHFSDTGHYKSLVSLAIVDPFTPLRPASTPCNGPHCSRTPDPIAPVEAPSTVRLRNSDQAALLADLAHPKSNGERLIIPESERGAFFEPRPLFRPPCLP